MATAAPLLTVVYTGEPDQVYEFAAEGQRRTFGRDDHVCDIIIWAALNGRDLARVAGAVWRMDDELWVRNLSTTHELHIQIPGMPPEQPLAVRRDSTARGPARSLPAPMCLIIAPGGCELLVRQLHQPSWETFSYGLDEPTQTVVPEVPRPLHSVATALCEPLLAGSQLPATYSEIMARLGESSLKAARRQVAELCSHYTDASPQLRRRVIDRLQREEEELQLPADPTLRNGLWSFERKVIGSGTGESADIRRRRALSLPDYYEVALLLVRYYRITVEDISLLPPRDETP